jgi:hypothetical protein
VLVLVVFPHCAVIYPDDGNNDLTDIFSYLDTCPSCFVSEMNSEHSKNLMLVLAKALYLWAFSPRPEGRGNSIFNTTPFNCHALQGVE